MIRKENKPLPNPSKIIARGLACIHCQKRSQCRARGLCWPCSMNPEIRDLYPARKGWYKRFAVPKKVDLPEPTQAAPGSEEKIRVLMDRFAKRQRLDHPDDLKIDPEEKVNNNKSFEKKLHLPMG